MKKILAALVFAAAASVSSIAMSAEQTVKLDVPGMFCASCPYIVSTAISALNGIKSVETSLENRTATVIFDDALTSIEAITSATTNVGYESSPVAPGANS